MGAGGRLVVVVWKVKLGTIEDTVNLQLSDSKLSEVGFGGDPTFFLSYFL